MFRVAVIFLFISTIGGHLDKEDFQDALALDPNSGLGGAALLVAACRIAVARELYEETGIDLRSKLERLKSVSLREKSGKSLSSEIKKRVFFKVTLEDSDFCTTGSESMGANPPPLMLKLSDEHQGFMFVPNVSKSVKLLADHSGGKVSKALQKAIDGGKLVD